MILNIKKLIYLLNCIKTPISIKIVRNKLFKFLSIQLLIHKSNKKKKELNKIWDAVINYNFTPLHIKDKFIISVYIVFALSLISACIGLYLYVTWIYAAL